MAKMWDHLMISYCKKSRHRIFFIGNKPAGQRVLWKNGRWCDRRGGFAVAGRSKNTEI